MSLARHARALAKQLADHGSHVVFAESCTAGLVAASLARVPGISEWLCGSAVTYRETTKQQWLGVTAADLARYSGVSRQVARQMAEGVLRKTPEADVAASVTGHLGPGAPTRSDGVIYIGIARRHKRRKTTTKVHRVRLETTTRVARQKEAASLVLQHLTKSLVVA